MMANEFPKRIIITGAGGFVGRQIISKLSGSAEITAVDLNLVDLPVARFIVGDLEQPDVVAEAVGAGCDAVIHLATVPGGAAEQDPAAAKRANIDGTMALIEAAARKGNRPRFIFASSISALGSPLPARVDDDTPLAPELIYGVHKAMMEQWIAAMSKRGDIDGMSLRLPGIVARPMGPSGMKSAFMSNVFHLLKMGEPFVSPVSAEATMWLMSVGQVADNFIHALSLESDIRALTLPSTRTSMEELIATIIKQTDSDGDNISFEPDKKLEAAFGSYPPLTTENADDLGFQSDGSIENLVNAAFATLGS